MDANAFMPHGYCYLWRPGLVALHVSSDLVIGLSYLGISATLVYFVYRGREHIPFHWMILSFGAFIVACGLTHFFAIWTLWNPDYWISGSVKAWTAVVSAATAIALPPLVPRALELVRAHEIAEQQRAELEVAQRKVERLEPERAARQSAEAANRAKDEFLAVLSHEMRTPLSPIIAWSQLLRDGALAPEQATRALDAIYRNARIQAQLVEDLLDVSGIISGKLRIERRPLDLETVVDRALEVASTGARDKGVALVRQRSGGAVWIEGDATRAQQIVGNLLSNAIKFTPRGGSVEIETRRADGFVELRVRDTGQGIAPEALAHIFDRFWQADATLVRKHGGLGLGLSIVRHLVELHGGAVEVSSDGVGKGAEFVVRFPEYTEKAGAAVLHPEDGDRTAATVLARLQDLRVLVVDDEPDSNELVRTILVNRGAEVRVAASTAQALRILESWRPDVLVSDIAMPGEDGFALISRLRASEVASSRRGIPAVALTALARQEDRTRILMAGFQMHVAKPVDPLELAIVIASVAERREGAPPN